KPPPPSPVRHRLLEAGEGAVAETAGEVDDGQAEAEVGLVAAVALHRLGVGKARELGWRRDGGEGEDAREEPLDQLVDVLLGGERHLDVDLGEFGLAVGAQVLVAEAAGDLDVALEASHLEDLLEELRRLRQGVEAAAVDARGDQGVARAFGGGLGGDGGLDVEEPLLVEVGADLVRHPVAEDEVLLQLGAAQVEEAVAQAEVLGGLDLAVEREGGRLGAGEHGGALGGDLDLAGGEIAIDLARLAAPDGPLDLDDPFGADLPQRLADLGVCVGPQHDLDDAAAIAQVEEEEAAEVPPALHPGLEPHPAPHVRDRDRPRSPTFHRLSFSWSWVSPGTRSIPEQSV